MKAKWKKFDDEIQEFRLANWIEANVFAPSVCSANPKNWTWNVDIGYKEFTQGRAKTESLAKQAAERELVKLFRELGKALDYDVE